jgi:hypothetical protein
MDSQEIFAPRYRFCPRIPLKRVKDKKCTDGRTMELTVNPWRNVMKNRILALVGLALLAAASASAQNIKTIAVNVPFAFQAGDRHMPAGAYLIEHPSSTVFILRGPGAAGAIVSTYPEAVKAVPSQAFVTFHRVGDRYFLGGFWKAGNDNGMECYPSRAEKEALEALRRDETLTTLALNIVPAR